MKKILSVLLALTCLLSLLVACKPTEHDPASGEKPSKYSKGLDYEVNGNYCTITGIGKCKDTEIYIPEEIGGKKVYVIGAKAFEGNTNVTKIWLPDTVDQIERRAFKDCTNLKVINIPENVTEIGDQILDGCVLDEFYMYVTDTYTYGEVDLPACKKLIFGGSRACTPAWYREAAYSGCDILEEVVLLDTVEYTTNYEFAGCKNLRKVTIADSVKHISEGSFANCPSITEFIIPDSVTLIGKSAFEGCIGLTNITIPNSIEKIHTSAFANCTNLTQFNFSGTMQEWEAIEKWNIWNDGLPATVVHCTDGDVPIN